jgi:hypothetical protein
LLSLLLLLLLLLLLQMLVVTELDDPFLPMPDDLLVNLRDSRELVDALLDALPAGYSASTSNDVAMGPALQVARVQRDTTHGALLPAGACRQCSSWRIAQAGRGGGTELQLMQAATPPEQTAWYRCVRANAGLHVPSVVAC